MEKLKPCPFCGGKADYVQYNDDGIVFVQCMDCGGETIYFDKEEDAAEAWNRRSETGGGTEWISVKESLPEREQKSALLWFTSRNGSATVSRVLCL